MGLARMNVYGQVVPRNYGKLAAGVGRPLCFTDAVPPWVLATRGSEPIYVSEGRMHSLARNASPWDSTFLPLLLLPLQRLVAPGPFILQKPLDCAPVARENRIKSWI